MNPQYRILLRLVPYLKAHSRTVGAGALCALAAGGLGGAIAWLVKPVMDGIFISRDVTMLKLIPLAILGVSVIKGAAGYGEGDATAVCASRVPRSTMRPRVSRTVTSTKPFSDVGISRAIVAPPAVSRAWICPIETVCPFVSEMATLSGSARLDRSLTITTI